MSNRKFRGNGESRTERLLRKIVNEGLPKKFARCERTVGRLDYFKQQIKGRDDANDLRKKFNIK